MSYHYIYIYIYIYLYYKNGYNIVRHCKHLDASHLCTTFSGSRLTAAVAQSQMMEAMSIDRDFQVSDFLWNLLEQMRHRLPGFLEVEAQLEASQACCPPRQLPAPQSSQ